MNKAPLTFNYIKKVVAKLKAESEYIDKCRGVGFELFEYLPTYGLVEETIDKIFTPDEPKHSYDTFSWWRYASEFGEKELSYWTVEGEEEIEHNVTKLEDLYKLLCEEKGCEPVWD